MTEERNGPRHLPAAQQDDHHRAGLLVEAGAILERVRRAIWSLPSDTDTTRVETLMRDIHSYKSLVAFAKLGQVVHLATDLEAYLALLYQGRLALDADAASLVVRAVDALALLHSSEVCGARADCAAVVAEVHSSLAALSGTDATPDTPSWASRPAASASRLMSAQVDAGKLAEVESLATTSYRLLRRLDDAEAFRRDERTDLMRLALDNSLQRLQQVAHSCRFCPLRDLFAPAAEMAEEMAPLYAKRLHVDLDVEPIDIELSLAQALRPAVLHIIRNAVAHGVETVEARVAAGKPGEGTIVVSARRSGDKLSIAVSDDGRGFDVEALKEAAVSLGAISRERGASMGSEDAIALAYIPGMSTASRRTELSGTGMGMSSVAEDISSLGGSVSIESEPGRGASVRLELPLPPGA